MAEPITFAEAMARAELCDVLSARYRQLIAALGMNPDTGDPELVQEFALLKIEHLKAGAEGRRAEWPPRSPR